MIIQYFMLPKLLWTLSHSNCNMAIAYMISESLIQLVFLVYRSYNSYLSQNEQDLKGPKYADGI